MEYLNELVLSNLEEENRLRKEGYRNIAGVDEVGRGCIFGPVVAGAVILKDGYYNKKIKDSKKLSVKQREQLAKEIIENCKSYSFGVIENDTIDQINIFESTKLAMKEAINGLSIVPDFILIDAVKLDSKNSKSIIKGDDLIFVISCASIIAKVYRDDMIKDFAKSYPNYDLENNKGYLTKKHKSSINMYGLTDKHRHSYKIKS